MKPTVPAARRLRMKPLAAGLAIVLATGVLTLPVDSLAATSSLSARARSWHGLLVANPALKARVDARQVRQADKRQARLERIRAKAASTTVAPNAPTAVSNCNDSGAGSLRDAVAAASTGDTIDLSTLTCSTITLTSGAISVGQNDLTIAGPGASSLAIDANGSDVAFNMYGSGTFTVADTTLTNGYYYGDLGGAIWATSGNVVLSNAVISNSETYSYYGNAGGAAVVAYGGDITLENSTVTGNTSNSYSPYFGYLAYAAVTAISGSVMVSNSTISGNQAMSSGYYGAVLGAGIFSAGSVSVADSTIAQNDAGGPVATFGGGIYASGGATLTASTVSGNSAISNAGGVQSQGALAVVNSTISGNQSNYYGAGLANLYGTVDISNSTVTSNTNAVYAGAGITTYYTSNIALDSSIIYGNTSGTGSGDIDDAGTGVTITGATNLIGDSSVTVPGDTISSDPLLGPLQNNGGPTATHALGTGSPAIDTGANPMTLATDQRGAGYARTAGGITDIGAFEVQGAVLLPPSVPLPSNATWAMGLLGMLLGWMSWAGLRRRREETTGGMS